ncbi:MAG: hypothetical protein JXA57_06740 [Armatimonadetes bacterium]|nr:hypothetical protein [Armatimonadota bacterium]
MIVPTVVALLLDQAEAVLQQQGVAVASVKQTHPPEPIPVGPLRVIRQRTSPEGVELVAAASIPLLETEKNHGPR